jgi:peptide deformylase
MSLTLDIQEKQVAIYGGGETKNVSLQPRYKFNFQLRIDMDSTELSGINSQIYEKVKSVSISDLTFDTIVANQYNIKRVIQKRINYGLTNIAFYDTYDNSFKRILSSYYSNYYDKNGFNSVNDTGLSSGTITGNFDTGIGYKLTDKRNFIKKITIIQYAGNNQNNYNIVLVNPKITNVVMEALDYSESALSLFNVSFQPEYVSYNPAPDAQTQGPQTPPSPTGFEGRSRGDTRIFTQNDETVTNPVGSYVLPSESRRGFAEDALRNFNSDTTRDGSPFADQTSPPVVSRPR